MTAEARDVARTFVDIPYPHRHAFNWGTAPGNYRDEWNVDADTYINGIVLTVDADYYMGYLLEVVDRESSRVRFVVVCTFHGGSPPDNAHLLYPHDCGTFFERTPEAAHRVVGKWAVDTIEDMFVEYRHPEEER